MKRFYKSWKPKQESMALVNLANVIIREYELDGYTLTLRQLYYQLVARDMVPNTERSYKNLGTIITKARLAGFISWEAIEDRNRTHNGFWIDEDEINAIRDLPNFIRFDQWARQKFYVEVWVEKEALGNVVSRACNKYIVPHLSCKGYLSSSEAWRAGRRFKQKIEEGKNCVLLHLGDHDPSGIDMTRDNQDRLNLFSEAAHGVEVKRLALNMNQVNEFNPPPNPTKVTDSRAKEYIKQFGSTSWELDALPPSIIEKLITYEIEELIDFHTWNEVEEEEEEKKTLLRSLYKNWPAVKQILVKGE